MLVRHAQLIGAVRHANGKGESWRVLARKPLSIGAGLRRSIARFSGSSEKKSFASLVVS
jgi:hypothetical protein